VVLSSGCSSLTELPSDLINETHRIAVFTHPVKNSFVILDHTEVWDKSYTHGQYGAIGGLLEGIILTIESSQAKKSSLGGDPDELEDMLQGYSIEAQLNKDIVEKLSTSFEVVNLNSFIQSSGEKKLKKPGIKQSKSLAYENGATMLVTVDYLFGLATYALASATAAIDSEVVFYDAKSGDKILKKKILSDEVFIKRHSIKDYELNDGDLFKIHMNEVSDAFSIRLANEFGLFKDEERLLRRNRVLTEMVGDVEISATPLHMLSMNCKKPFLLTQDCSTLFRSKRKIRINDEKVKISGSEDGKGILLMKKSLMFDFKGKALKNVLGPIKDILKDEGINITRVMKVISGTSLNGYYIELDGDGYSILKGY